MTRKNLVCKKLTEVSDGEWRIVMAKCKKLIDFRTSGKTEYGAHSEARLGMSPFEYYFQKAIDNLYEGKWDWKFEKFTLSQQMVRMIGSIISEEVRKYQQEQKDRKAGKHTAPKFVAYDNLADVLSIDPNDEMEKEEYEEKYAFQLKIIEEAIRGNDDMESLFIYVLDGKSKDEICQELGWDKKKLYRVTERLVNKAKNHVKQQQ